MAESKILMPIRTKGSKPPLFVIHGEPLKIAIRIRADRPVYGISLLYHPDLGRIRHTLPSTIEQYAELYLEDVRRVQPKGPYYLCGYSAGGTIAFEMASMLMLAGEVIGDLTLVEPTVTELEFNFTVGDKLAGALDYLLQSTSKLDAASVMLRKLAWAQKQRLIKIINKLTTKVYVAFNWRLPEEQRWTLFIKYLNPVIHSYVYPAIDCRATLVYGVMDETIYKMWAEFWAKKFVQLPEIISIETAFLHLDLMEDPSLGRVISLLDRAVSSSQDSYIGV
jgi:thioesterase domain-containing protein